MGADEQGGVHLNQPRFTRIEIREPALQSGVGTALTVPGMGFAAYADFEITGGAISSEGGEVRVDTRGGRLVFDVDGKHTKETVRA